MYARGMSAREIVGHLRELYGIEMSPDLISAVTDAVLDEIAAWHKLRGRGVEDLLLAVVDGLKGFPEAILAVFPQTQVQTCIVHLLRQSLNFVAYKDRKMVAAALKAIYQAVDAAAEAALTTFEAGAWGQKYPAIGQSWCRA